ncbi:MAG: aldo/keto reductase, partial [Armatimonadota bacterium]|nr:aldo/keto reductase [Armatimonadota bacterium]
MKYRILGRTGMRVSVVGVGTWQFGGSWGKDFSQQEVDAMLGRAKELGINLIDTAECYGPNHLSETLIGRFLENLSLLGAEPLPDTSPDHQNIGQTGMLI